jgi:hydroxyacylglutathione hydrolase
MKKKVNLQEIIAKMKQNLNDVTIKTFHFNMIQVNTLVIFDQTLDAVIVDPGNSNPNEDLQLLDYIQKENLNIKYILNTHPHIDHVLGNAFCKKNFPNALLLAHKMGLPIYNQSIAYGSSFGFTQTEFPLPDQYISGNDTILFGNQTWNILETFGHADGSICLYDKHNQFVIVGDVLFEGGIGRTDLPTGNYHLLIDNIKNKLFTLPDETVVIPGHADTTTIIIEKETNPYL